MSDPERFSMTEANLCSYLLDRHMHHDANGNKLLFNEKESEFLKNSKNNEDNIRLLKEIEVEFDERRKRNGFSSLRDVLNYCIQTANMCNFKHKS